MADEVLLLARDGVAVVRGAEDAVQLEEVTVPASSFSETRLGLMLC